MELIKLFILGSAGYILLFIYDLSQLYNKPLIRYMSSVGFLLTGLPYVILIGKYGFVQLTLYEYIILFVLFLLTLLLVYSVLIEIPLYYHRSKPINCDKNEPEIYCYGTYSFSRHPGFIWYTCINIMFVAWNLKLFLLMMILTAWNFLLILIEDKYIFPKTFKGYDTYKKAVPFILSCKNVFLKGDHKA